MSQLFTYNFSDGTEILITVDDNPSVINFGDPIYYSGYRIQSIAGTINGSSIVGLVTASSLNGSDFLGPNDATASFFDNVIFTDASQGYNNYSNRGIDALGVTFRASNGRDYTLSSSGPDYSLYYGTNSSDTDFRSLELSSTDAPCFASGTLIRTTRGDVAIEDLAIGDVAVTASRQHRTVRWIGHRTVNCRRHAKPFAIQPVRIAAGAFGDRRPARDLLVSPAHAIAVDVLGEVLIPACRLTNGTTITQVDVEEVTYWHVELESHDILLAEGLPVESYLDCGNRRFFNADATDVAMRPDHRREGAPRFCRPFHEAGPVVDLVRARLQERAEALGWRRVEATFAGLHLVADGRPIHADVAGLTARFVLPADARDVRLVCETGVPAHVVPGSTDDRRLGVAVASLVIDDGLTEARRIALDDARLGDGFHAIDGGARWTDGAAVLPASLWEACKGSFFLCVTLAGPALPRWIAPGETAGAVAPTACRRRA